MLASMAYSIKRMNDITKPSIPVLIATPTRKYVSIWYLDFFKSGKIHYILISKLVPQPQLLDASGLSTILNWLPINSIVKSTLLPFNNSRLGPSITTFAPDPSSVAKTVSSSSNSATLLARLEKGGAVKFEDKTFDVWEEGLSAGELSSSVGMDAESRGGRVVSDIRYWKPWQPPLST